MIFFLKAPYTSLRLLLLKAILSYWYSAYATNQVDLFNIFLQEYKWSQRRVSGNKLLLGKNIYVSKRENSFRCSCNSICLSRRQLDFFFQISILLKIKTTLRIFKYVAMYKNKWNQRKASGNRFFKRLFFTMYFQ